MYEPSHATTAVPFPVALAALGLVWTTTRLVPVVPTAPAPVPGGARP